MAEKKKELLARKVKEAGDLANKAGEGVATAWKDLNGKAKDGIQRAYQSKRPLAMAKVNSLKEEYPKISPREAQEILDSELSSVEASKGPLSVRYTSAASLYVMASIELRQLDPKSQDTAKALFNLLIILDGRAVRGLRHILNVGLWLLPFAKEMKAAKAVPVVAKGAQVVVKANKAKKVLKTAKAVALPVAKGGLDNLLNSGKASAFIIEQTAKTLGPAPASWKSQAAKASKAKTSTKSSKK
jgi:hypothetical protein